MENQQHGLNITRPERYGATRKKHITLTLSACEEIQSWADTHHLNFSTAIETLALMSLQHDRAHELPRLVANLVQQVVMGQFNRLAKLLAGIALSSEAVNYKMDVLLLQTIWREARLNPDGFLEKMMVSDDPTKQPDALVRQVRDELKATAHEVAVTQLKKSLSDLWEVEVSDG